MRQTKFLAVNRRQQIERLRQELPRIDRVKAHLGCFGYFGAATGYLCYGAALESVLEIMPDDLNPCSVCSDKDACWRSMAQKVGETRILQTTKANVGGGYDRRIADSLALRGPFASGKNLIKRSTEL